ncbi:uncharacterized protein [Pocillopora verrucosa]|uniref:uncharacterized protein n=1 Tax=Pocillopora verrucosa TaxID=203993 RepID=UPI00333FE2EA
MNDEWARDTVQMYSRNELGQVPGHYLKIDGKSVVAYATDTDPKTQLKFLHTVDLIGQKAVQMIILASSSGGTVVAVNKTDDTVFVKTLSTSLSSLNRLKQVKLLYPEILFRKVSREAGSEIFYLKSYLSGKRRILGFDKKGLPLNTSQVRPDSVESFITII